MRYLLIILLVFGCYAAHSQTRPSGNPTQFNTGRQKWGWQQADSGTILPIYTSIPSWTPTFPYTTIGVRTISDTSIYYWSGLSWKPIASGGGGLFTASNGLTAASTDVQLGGPLTHNTDIDLGGDSLRLLGASGGFARIRASSGGFPALVVENTSTGAFEGMYVEGENASLRLIAKKNGGFAGITYHSNGILRGSTGYDGPFNHIYIMDLKNGTPSGTFEAEGVPFSGFTYTKHFFIGTLPTPDTAQVNIFKVPSAAVADSGNIMIFASDRNGTFNTSGGAISHKGAIIEVASSRSAGASNLTNIGLKLTAKNAQTNQALLVDTGDVVIGLVGNSNSLINGTSYATVANLGVTQKRSAAYFEMGRTLTDTLGSNQTFSSGLYGRATYAAKAFAQLQDNLSGSAGEFTLTLIRNTAFTGRTVYQGTLSATNNVTTMASALVARFNVNQANTGLNSVRAQGYWAGITSHIALNTGDSVGIFAWFNGGAAQTTGGGIDTAIIYYAGVLPTLATRKYAFFNAGIADTNYFAGIMRFPNLTTGISSDSVLVENNGVVKKVLPSSLRSPTYNAQSGTTYTVLSTDASTIIGFTNTAARTITLALASSFPAGTIIIFKDEAGTAGTGNITLNRSGSDTIDGATSKVINTNFGMTGLYTNGTNWFTW